MKHEIIIQCVCVCVWVHRRESTFGHSLLLVDPHKLPVGRQLTYWPVAMQTLQLSNVLPASYTAASWKQLPGAPVSPESTAATGGRSRHSFIKNSIHGGSHTYSLVESDRKCESLKLQWGMKEWVTILTSFIWHNKFCIYSEFAWSPAEICIFLDSSWNNRVSKVSERHFLLFCETEQINPYQQKPDQSAAFWIQGGAKSNRQSLVCTLSACQVTESNRGQVRVTKPMRRGEGVSGHLQTQERVKLEEKKGCQGHAVGGL